MNLQEQIELLEHQKKALTTYLRMCVYIKSIPRADVVDMVENCNDIEKLQECIRMFEETKWKYKNLTKDV